MINYRNILLPSFSVGGLTLNFYWVLFFLGLFIVHRLLTASFSTGNFAIYDNKNSKFIDYPKRVNQIVIWSGVGWQIGGRLGNTLLHFDKVALLEHPVWQVLGSGFSSRCAVLGTFVATFLVAKRSNLSTVKLADLLSFITPTFLFLIRISEFLSDGIPGRPTSLPFGVIYPHYGEIPRHPFRLYQALLEGFLLQVFLVFNKKQFSFKGRMTCLFLIGYIVAGDIAAYFRDPEVMPDVMIGEVSFRNLVSLLLGGLVLYIALRKTRKVAKTSI